MRTLIRSLAVGAAALALACLFAAGTTTSAAADTPPGTSSSVSGVLSGNSVEVPLNVTISDSSIAGASGDSGLSIPLLTGNG